VLRSAEFDLDAATDTLSGLDARCRAFLDTLAAPTETGAIQFSVEAKYEDQNWEIVVPLVSPDKPGEDFLPTLIDTVHREHQRLYHHHDPDAEILFLTWRARATPRLGPWPVQVAEPPVDLPPGERPVKFPGQPLRTVPVVTSGQIGGQTAMTGPLIVQTTLTSIVVDDRAKARVAASGAMLIDVWEVNRHD
jgi:N-methylhydantoinase A